MHKHGLGVENGKWIGTSHVGTTNTLGSFDDIWYLLVLFYGRMLSLSLFAGLLFPFWALLFLFMLSPLCRLQSHRVINEQRT